MSKKAEERDANYKKIEDLKEKIKAGTANFKERNIVNIFEKRRLAARKKDAELSKAAASASKQTIGKLIHTGRLKRP